MKYIIIPYIALGLVLSLVVGVEYNCNGQEMFPEYYGSPFIFKQKSLGSSMEYYFSVSGLILNTTIWSIVILLIRMPILKLIKNSSSNSFKNIYRKFIVALIVFSTLNIAINYVMLGRGFEKGFNYWYMDLDKEASEWGMNCKGKWGFSLFSM